MYRTILARQTIPPLLQLMIQQRQRFLVRTDFAQTHIHLYLTTIELTINLGAPRN